MINDVSKTTKTNITTTTAMAISDLRQTPSRQEQIMPKLDNCEGGSGSGGGGGRLTEDDEFPAVTTHTFATNNNRNDNDAGDDRDCKHTTAVVYDEVVSTTTTLPVRATSSEHCRQIDSSTSGCSSMQQKKREERPQQYAKEQSTGGELLPKAALSTSLSLSPSTTPSLLLSLTVKPSSSLVVLQNQAAATLTHKNITNVACEASYHRTLETETSTVNSGKADQCELLESTAKTFTKQTQPEEEEQTDYRPLKTLAERKALLKQEFFKDFPSSSSSSTTDYSSSSSKPGLSKRLLKKQHNLKLKITTNPFSKNLYKEQIFASNHNKTSLVALRKLDLQRQAKQSNFSCDNSPEESSRVFPSNFPSVKELARRFDYPPKMIVPQTKLNSSKEMDMVSLKPDQSLDQRNSPLSDEGCNLGQSPYSSDDDNDSIRTTHTAIERLPSKRKDKVARSASSDSALGLDVDESMDTSEPSAPTAQQQQKRRMTLTVTDLPLRPALLPLAEPTLLPDSPPVDILNNINLNQTQVPSKVLIEERVVEIPEDPRSGGSSRRESSQSCLSDYPASDLQGVRFVRTPSVVVSDYSDDIMCGITLEEIEYFRAQRMRRRRSSLETAGTEKDALDNNSDVSAASSCSNLYYCGSTISALDGAECLVNGMRMQLERKTSDCSTCSVSGDEESSPNFTIPEQPEDCQDLSDMLANQHLSCKRSKKVGVNPTTGFLTVDHTIIP